MKYIDIHCHLNLEEFDQDYNEAIDRARKNDTGMIVVGTNLQTSRKAIKIAENNPDIWAIIGLHPIEIPCEQFDYDIYKKLAKHPKVVGIGECGFDYLKKINRPGYDNRDLQKEIFIKQIEIANEVKKPLMLHIRNGMDGEHDAYRDAIEILKKHNKVSGDVHFFAGSVEIAKEFLGIGFRLSFTGVITFVRDFDEVIKNTPLNMIMSETDSPYVTPVPFRGQKNEPAYVSEIANMIAKIKNQPIEKVLPQLVENAKALFNL